jgi:hypothetical protein
VRLVCLATFVTACGRMNFDVPGDARDGDACGTFARPPISSFVDDFGDGVIDSRYVGISPCIMESGGELVASPAANSPELSYCLVFTLETFQLTCDAMTVHVPQATTPITGTQTVMYFNTPGHHIDLLLDTGGFQMAPDRDASRQVIVPELYDPVADAWWRIRADPDAFYFDTSPDGATWKVRGSMPLTFSLDEVQIGFGAGAYRSIPDPGTARFRCLNLLPPSCT